MRRDLAISVRQLSKSYQIRSDPHHGRSYIPGIFRRPNQAQFETFWALRDVSLEIPTGAVVGIVGRNGAGKSTLLKILSRITEPTSGQVDLFGRVGSLLEVGTGFHPELTGRENIFLNGQLLGMRRRDVTRYFDEIVAFAETERFIDTPVKRYSSGMYVRLAFAVAAHLTPEILIVDEVLAVGDTAFQKKCLAKMGDVAARQGRTVIFVSHQMSALQALCTTAILLRSGTVERIGPVENVIDAYFQDALVSSTGCFDLTAHPARAQGCLPWITQLSISGGKSAEKSVLKSTEALQVRILVQPKRALREPRIAIAIEDPAGRRIGTVASYFKSDQIGPIAEATTVICDIPHLRLGPGRYLLSVSVGEKATGLLDSVDGAAWFDVEWDNAYGNGEPHLPVYGPSLIESNWSTSI